MYRTQGFLGQGVACGHHPGNSKVRHLYRTVFQHHHVMGLDVTVDDTPAVSMIQCLGNLNSEVEGLLPVEGSLFLHILLQRNAIDQLHDDVIRFISGGNVINRHDVRMAEHGNSLTLRMEAAAELFILGIFRL